MITHTVCPKQTLVLAVTAHLGISNSVSTSPDLTHRTVAAVPAVEGEVEQPVHVLLKLSPPMTSRQVPKYVFLGADSKAIPGKQQVALLKAVPPNQTVTTTDHT